MSKCTRIAVDVHFMTQAEADAGIAALLAAGYDVLIALDLVDEDSDETVYVEVQKALAADQVIALPLPGNWPPIVDDTWDDVRRIAEQFHGGADTCGAVEADHVPFSNYDGSTRWRRA